MIADEVEIAIVNPFPRCCFLFGMGYKVGMGKSAQLTSSIVKVHEFCVESPEILLADRIPNLEKTILRKII